MFDCQNKKVKKIVLFQIMKDIDIYVFFKFELSLKMKAVLQPFLCVIIIALPFMIFMRFKPAAGRVTAH